MSDENKKQEFQKSIFHIFVIVMIVVITYWYVGWAIRMDQSLEDNKAKEKRAKEIIFQRMYPRAPKN